MSATGKPSSSSLPSRYSRVRAWHRVGLIWQMEDAPAISWCSEPAAFARPDGGGVIVFSSLRPDLRRAASIKGFVAAASGGLTPGGRAGMPIGARGSSYLTFASVLDAQAGPGEAMPSA